MIAWNNNHTKIKTSLLDLGIIHDTFPKQIETIFLVVL